MKDKGKHILRTGNCGLTLPRLELKGVKSAISVVISNPFPHKKFENKSIFSRVVEGKMRRKITILMSGSFSLIWKGLVFPKGGS